MAKKMIFISTRHLYKLFETHSEQFKIFLVGKIIS